MNTVIPLRPHALRCLGIAWLLMLASVVHAAPQIPDFVYQGRLEQDGAPANGAFDLTFTLYDQAQGGNAVGVAIEEPGYPVVGGLFTVSLAFPGAFTGEQLYLEVGVEGTPMLPRQAVATAPVSQYSLSGALAGPAGGDLTGSYPNPAIASSAVTSGKLASFSVTNSKLAQDSVTASKIAAAAVTTAKLQDDAVTIDKLASNSVTIASFLGGSGSGAISYNIGANDCDEVNIVFGGIAAGDFVVLNTDPMPEDVFITALDAPAANTMRIKICNAGPASQSFTNLGVRYISLR